MSEPARIFGLMVVRNEADILRVNLLHHFSAGLEHVLVVDNGSSDDTRDVLEEFAREGRLTWTRDSGAYRQAALTTELGREAHGRGADWLMPIDADEFWYAPTGSLQDVLGGSRAGGLLVQVINFIQRREQTQGDPAALLHVTHRAPLPVGPLECVQRYVENREYAFVEAMYQPKWIARSSPAINIAIGNHEISGVDGPLESTDDIVCLHVPLRSRAVLQGKVEHGARVAALGLDPKQGWHVLRWLKLQEEGELDREWCANSYLHGALDVFGTPHQVVFDPTLRDLVRPWIVSDSPASSRDELRELRADLEAVKITLHRLLQRAFANDISLRRTLATEIAARDEQIAALQEELFTKVAARDERIAVLQEELFTKVAARDERIAVLQEELFTKVAQANEVIRNLQGELRPRDERIVALQEELFTKVAQANEAIRNLQAEMHRKIGEANEIIRGLQEDLARATSTVDPSKG